MPKSDDARYAPPAVVVIRRAVADTDEEHALAGARNEENRFLLTLSNGEGAGYVVPGTGVMMNNMLGEEDINPQGFDRWPLDVRLGSMMAPTAVETAERLIVLGSGGSNRIRTAVLQVIVNLLAFDMTASEAVAAPRIHVERGHLDMEPGWPEATAVFDDFPDPESCVICVFQVAKDHHFDMESRLNKASSNPCYTVMKYGK